VIRRLQILVLGAAGILLAGGTVFAHHVWPVDQSKEITVKGTVTGYNWANPHVMIGLDVADDGGKVVKWNVGGPSTARMAGNGWDRNTLKGGEVITASGFKFTDGSNILRLEKIVMADGKEMFLYGRR
jgi:hypothetical protein